MCIEYNDMVKKKKKLNPNCGKMVSANQPITERDSFYEKYSTKSREKTEGRREKRSKEKRANNLVRKQTWKKIGITKISGIVEQYQTVEQAIRRDMAVAVVQITPPTQPPKSAYAIGRSGYYRGLVKARL